MTEAKCVGEVEGWGDWVLERREVEYVGEDECWRVRALGKTVEVEEVAEDEDLSLGRTWVV